MYGRLAIAAGFAALTCCGVEGLDLDTYDEPMASDVRLQNNYAASLFTVAIEYGDRVDTIAEEVRIDGLGSERFEDAITCADGDPLLVHFSAMTLGEWYEWEPVETDCQLGATFKLAFDWDIATADFVVSYGWGY